MAIITAFQAEDGSSILPTRSTRFRQAKLGYTRGPRHR